MMKSKAYKLAKAAEVFSWILVVFYGLIVLLQFISMGVQFSYLSYGYDAGFAVGTFIGTLLACTVLCGIGFVVLRGLAAVLRMTGDLHEKAGLSVPVPVQRQAYGPQDLQM